MDNFNLYLFCFLDLCELFLKNLLYILFRWFLGIFVLLFDIFKILKCLFFNFFILVDIIIFLFLLLVCKIVFWVILNIICLIWFLLIYIFIFFFKFRFNIFFLERIWSWGNIFFIILFIFFLFIFIIGFCFNLVKINKLFINFVSFLFFVNILFKVKFNCFLFFVVFFSKIFINLWIDVSGVFNLWDVLDINFFIFFFIYCFFWNEDFIFLSIILNEFVNLFIFNWLFLLGNFLFKLVIFIFLIVLVILYKGFRVCLKIVDVSIIFIIKIKIERFVWIYILCFIIFLVLFIGVFNCINLDGEFKFLIFFYIINW